MTVLEKNSKEFKDNYIYNSKKVLDIVKEAKKIKNKKISEKKIKGEG